MYQKTHLSPSVFALLALASVASQSVGEETGASAPKTIQEEPGTSTAPTTVGKETGASAAPKTADKETDPCGDEKGPCCELDWTGQGATIVKIQGEAMVSQSPWVNATLGMRVRNGGRVLALDRSTAVCAFDDGCWHVLGENEMLTIGDVSPCCAARVPPVAPPPLAAPPPLPPPAASSLTWLLPVLPTAAIGACVATDCVGNSDDPEPPRTPISQ